MNSEPIVIPSINYGTAINPADGFFNAAMLVAALGFAAGGTQNIATAVAIGALAAPDFRPASSSCTTWLWKPDTVKPFMTASAALPVRNAVRTAQTATQSAA